MEKIYYSDRYKRELKATIIDIFTREKMKDFGEVDKLGILFDKSIVFPGGGGQARDISWIVNTSGRKIDIIDVIELDENLNLHIVEVDSNLSVGDNVTINIDWENREDNMHQHSAQHILSGCFFKLFNSNTKSLHIGKEFSQLDIEGEFTDEMIYEIEKYANQIIGDSIDIENYIDEEGSEKTRRPLPEDKGEIRILKIGDLDTNACCGVHVYNTRDIRAIKIIKHYRNKGGTRIEYIAGNRAIKYFLRRDKLLSEVLAGFNCGEQNIDNAIRNLKEEKEKFYQNKKYITSRYFELLSDSLLSDSNSNNDGIIVIKKIFDNEEIWFINELAKYITDNYKSIVLFANIKDELVNLVLLTSKKLSKEYSNIELGNDFREFSNLISAKGGGSNFSANGICDKNDKVEDFLDKIYLKYI